MVFSILKRQASQILFTGAGGQVGSDLLKAIQEKHGIENVLATDLKGPSPLWDPSTKFSPLDVTDSEEVEKLFSSFKPKIIYHLASTLSAPSEKNPQLAFKVNFHGVHNVLEQARKCQAQIFAASSIATFGEMAPKVPGDLDLQRPCSFYGITKVHLELMGAYYHLKHGVDFRCLRVPIVTSETIPGGGAGAFTVNVFYDFLKYGKTVIPVAPDTRMPLIYLKDLTKGIVDFMDADNEKLRFRTYTMASASCSVGEYVEEVKKYLQGDVVYEPDYRDVMIKSWPDGTDSGFAFRDWGHKINYDIPRMVKTLFENISKSLIKN
jgi:threonine 3-dehydrogenase